MSTLYLDRNHLRITARGGHLKVDPAGHGRGSYPLSLISRIVMRGRIEFDSATLACLADAGISMVCLAGRGHHRVATILGRPGPEARRRLGQYRTACDPELARGLAVRLVARKLSGYLQEAARLVKRRPSLRKPTSDLADSLQRASSNIATAELSSLRGIEGAASAAWFKFYARALPPRLGFKGRNRQPPRDPVNAALSLAYTLAHAEAVAASAAQGLDPMIGFLHEPMHARESLACDLVEPLRPHIDARVLEAFSSDSLRPDHFSTNDAGCRLTKTGRSHFYGLWESQAPRARRALRRLVLFVLREVAS